MIVSAVLLSIAITSSPCQERAFRQINRLAMGDERKPVLFRLVTEFHQGGTYDRPQPAGMTLAVYPGRAYATAEFAEAYEWPNGNIFNTGKEKAEIDETLAQSLSNRLWREIDRIRHEQGGWVIVCMDNCTDYQLLRESDCQQIQGDFWRSWPGRVARVLDKLTKKEVDRGGAEKELRALLDETTSTLPRNPTIGPAPNVSP